MLFEVNSKVFFFATFRFHEFFFDSFKDDGKTFRGHHDRDHGSFKNHEGLEMYQYLANETPIKMPRPDERGMRLVLLFDFLRLKLMNFLCLDLSSLFRF